MVIVFLAILSFLFFYLSQIIAKKYNLFDFADGIKIHKNNTPNIGGITLIPYILCIIYLFNFDEKISISLCLVLLVVLIGFVDDIKNITPQTKMIALLVPIYFFSKEVGIVQTLGNYGDYELKLGSFSFIFTILCIFLLTNAYNYIDGLDALLGINLIITLLSFIFFIGADKNIFISLIVFLIIYLLFNINFLKIFNKLFFGDSGSLAFGFLISSFLIFYTQEKNLVHPSIIIWPVAFVVYEFLSINIIRIKLSKNIFKRDLNFIFNIFEREYNWRISLLYCTSIHLIFCIIGLVMFLFKTYIISLFLFIIIFFIYLILRLRQKKFYV